MTLEELKTTIRTLPAQDRRRLALYILELEKDYVRDTVGPQISEDLDSVKRALQEAIDNIKRRWEGP
jgi:hypothetical protein